MRKASGATGNGAAFVLWVVVVPMALMAASAYFWTAAFPRAIPLRSGATPESVDVGQKFEVLGAVFTLGGYVALLATLWYQRQQLVDQRQRAAEDQVRSEFFQLLEAWQEIIHNAGYRGETGRATFVKLSEQLASVVEMKIGDRIGGEPGSDERNPNPLYELFYKGDVKALLGNYFRLFYHIIRYVDQSDLSQKDKDGLVRIARAYLSEPELHLLFWNAISQHGSEKTKPLVEKYDLLQNYGGFDDQQFKELYDFRAANRDAKGECLN